MAASTHGRDDCEHRMNSVVRLRHEDLWRAKQAPRRSHAIFDEVLDCKGIVYVLAEAQFEGSHMTPARVRYADGSSRWLPAEKIR